MGIFLNQHTLHYHHGYKTNYRDFHCWTRVTGGKENHQKTKTNRKIHKTTVFRHWATGNTIQWFLRKGNKWNGPSRCPSLLPGEGVQATAQGGEPRQSSMVPLRRGGRARNLGRPRRWESPGKSSREERAPEICRGPLSLRCCSPQACEETTDAGEHQQKGEGRVILRAHPGGGVVRGPTTQNFREKPWNRWSSGYSSQKITVLVVGPD